MMEMTGLMNHARSMTAKKMDNVVITFLCLEKTISNDAEELCCIIQNNCVGLDICTSTYPGVAVTHLLGTQQKLYLGMKIKEEKKTTCEYYRSNTFNYLQEYNV